MLIYVCTYSLFYLLPFAENNTEKATAGETEHLTAAMIAKKRLS
jgi:hypothetical protein